MKGLLCYKFFKMELFVLMDSAFFGRGVFGIFTCSDLAKEYRDKMNDIFCQWEIRRFNLIGDKTEHGLVYVAYLYHELYDLYSLDGIYANEEDAKDAVGNRGMVVEFRIDFPSHKRLILEG